MTKQNSKSFWCSADVNPLTQTYNAVTLNELHLSHLLNTCAFSVLMISLSQILGVSVAPPQVYDLESMFVPKSLVNEKSAEECEEEPTFHAREEKTVRL
ncbi:hypothetical protein BaRGS_00009326 [Batillaria attramentaria]|uniref:Uncharacterized protein n=1 Tax=Batillaria attramentaria TaxID=370345 RepID=A0ABD0LJI1_9CAEN